MLDVLFDVIVPVVAVAVIGGVAGRMLGFDLDTLTRIVFFLFSPALVFVGIADLDLGGNAVVRVAATSAAVFAVNAVLGLGWAALRGCKPEARSSIVVASAVPNQGNMGIPVARLAFGSEGLSIATLLFVIGVVLNVSAGVALGQAALGGHTTRRVLLSPLRYPAIYAAVAGVVVNVFDVDLPTAVHEPLATLAQAAIPVMLVVLGLSFRVPRIDDLADPIAVSVNRLLLGPLLAWSFALALGLHGTTRDVTILMAGMPAAVNTTILAAQLGADVALSVRLVVVSTLCSIVTLTALLVIL